VNNQPATPQDFFFPDRVSPRSAYQTTLDTLHGKKPARIPFVTRLEAWYKSHVRSGSLPARFKGMSLPEVHHSTGVGQLKFMVPYSLKLRGVEVESSWMGQPFYRENEPLFENFPGMWDIIDTEKAGETETNLHTRWGTLHLRHELLPEGVASGTDPYLQEHLIKDDNDLKVVEHILENCEFIPQFDKIAAIQAELGENAFVVPLLHRIPFQQALLEYFGEIELFYVHHDQPRKLERLLTLLHEQMLDILEKLVDFNWPYVEFPDNLHSMMTNPRLFREFCLPAYQQYTDILHRQGKVVGSHTDGDIKPLLSLLKESGLDVCESFSPYPLTKCTFRDAWEAWRGGPLIWGGISSPILEASTSDHDFFAYIEDLFETIQNEPVILGVVDLFMYHNSIERVEIIARQIDALSGET